MPMEANPEIRRRQQCLAAVGAGVGTGALGAGRPYWDCTGDAGPLRSEKQHSSCSGEEKKNPGRRRRRITHTHTHTRTPTRTHAHHHTQTCPKLPGSQPSFYFLFFFCFLTFWRQRRMIKGLKLAGVILQRKGEKAFYFISPPAPHLLFCKRAFCNCDSSECTNGFFFL